MVLPSKRKLDDINMASSTSSSETFTELDNDLAKLATASGIPSHAYAIAQRGRTTHKNAFGSAKLALNNGTSNILATSTTLYPVCSITKSFASIVIGNLVSDGHFAFTDTLAHLLPHFKFQDPAVGHVTLEECLSMRSGLEGFIMLGSYHSLLFRKSESQAVLESLHLRSGGVRTFAYNNWGWEMARHVIESFSDGKTWGECVKSMILEPLGLKRTILGNKDEVASFGDEAARAYQALDAGEMYEVEQSPMGDETILGIAGGMWSCVDDLTIFFTAVMTEMRIQFGYDAPPASDVPRPLQRAQLATTMQPHGLIAPFDHDPTIMESGYGIGFFRSVLPNHLIRLGYNARRLGAAPVIHTSTPHLMLGHWGTATGVSCAAFMFPAEEVVIVTLCNGHGYVMFSEMALGRMVEWVFKEDIPVGKRTDWMKCVERNKAAELKWEGEIQAELTRTRKKDADTMPPRALEEYSGRYVRDRGGFVFDITLDATSGQLRMRFNDNPSDIWTLTHHDADTFCWFASRDEILRRGRETASLKAEHYLVEFDSREEIIDGWNGEEDVGEDVIGEMRWMYAGTTYGEYEEMLLLKDGAEKKGE